MKLVDYLERNIKSTTTIVYSGCVWSRHKHWPGNDIKKLHVFMEPEVSLSSSQKPVTGPYPEADESRSNP
jgi:hypothetical protein